MTTFTGMLDRMRAAEEPRRKIVDRLLEAESPKRERIDRLLEAAYAARFLEPQRAVAHPVDEP